MTKELSKIYEPAAAEDGIYQKWEASGLFAPEASTSTEKYCNVLPPPNANGELHIGHASGYVVMDLLGRYNRMLGKKTLLLPGKDHAGIQTQVVFEKKLKKEQGLTRYDLGREKFYEACYAFCQDRAQYMRQQEKKIGLAADWNREKFTLDPKIIDIVLDTFIQMYNEVDANGKRMIYQGERIINWCPRCYTALSDIEVEYENKKTKLYTFKYAADFPFAISTTRPETKLGDTAVAVNPDDERYQEYIGQTFDVNFCGVPLKIKVIASPEVEASFGTGALGVTPAHSMVDWQMAEKHNLEIVKVIDEHGKIFPGFGPYSGLTAAEARELIVQNLKENNLMITEEDYENNLSVCERCKTPIEPLISKQWFVNMDHTNFSLKQAAHQVIENNEIKIHPERFRDTMLSWIDNVHDWCISRQIWWGPRIPIWYKGDQTMASKETPGEGWVQDEDTFDTWFSSGQWAYTTLGYPNGADFKEFYPSDTMIMGRDILPFWAFRMIILSLYRTKQAPFKNLYFTGLVRDEKGQKMSKSKGNGIEPLEMIQKYGTDAVRLSLVIGSTPGHDMNLGEAKIAGFRNFTNKLWNIARYILQSVEITDDLTIKNSDLTAADFWILEKMAEVIETVASDINNFRFSQAGESLKVFTWDYLADWYLEASKFEKSAAKEKILILILKDLCKLWHPFMPFVTEKLWQEMDQTNLLMAASWPDIKTYRDILGKEKITGFDLAKEIITTIRNGRSENKIEPTKKVDVTIYTGKNLEQVISQEHLIKALRTGIGELGIKESGEKLDDAIYLNYDGIEIYLLGGVNKDKEKQRLQEELKKIQNFIMILENKLANPEFSTKAPAKIVDIEKAKLSTAQTEAAKLTEQINNLK